MAATRTSPETMTEALTGSGTDPDLVLLFVALQRATKVIAARVARAAIDQLTGLADHGTVGGAGDKQKKLDVVSVSQYSSTERTAVPWRRSCILGACQWRWPKTPDSCHVECGLQGWGGSE